MTQQTPAINGNTFFFRVYPQQEKDSYITRYIDIYTISQYCAEHPSKDNGIEAYSLSNVLSIRYQKNSQSDEHASEDMKTYFYGESISQANLPVNSEIFLKIAKFFSKMENIIKQLDKKGLTLQDSRDLYLARVTLLKMAGAQKVEYNQFGHGFIVVMP